MSRIKNLYTYLIENRRPEVDEWLEDYLSFTTAVSKVQAALLTGRKLFENRTYLGTSFETDGWPGFAKHLLYENYNGISSRGQSVLSWVNFGHFIQDEDFVNALEELIKVPTKEKFRQYSEAWDRTRLEHDANRNPLLVNRTMAACTTNVSSTVNGADFDSVYCWLVREGFITADPGADSDWYDRNVRVMEFLQASFSEELNEKTTSNQLLSIFVWNLFENISNPFSLKKQVVKYGAPGTGKTYTAKKNVNLLFDIWRDKYPSFEPQLTREQCLTVVQFHPSYGYEDFIEGLRPKPLESGQALLQLQNGVFKEFCRDAGKWEIEVYAIPQIGSNPSKKWLDLTVGDLKPHIGQHLRHDSWQQLSGMDESEKIADIIPPYFFIIDEINRAELSRVLGELMYCMEYRGVDGAISTQYATLNDKDTAMLTTTAGPRFFIPHNVYIFGTMNTIDRSVESFDLALRRRFRWERANPDISALRYHLKQRDREFANHGHPWEELAHDLEQLNIRIRKTDDILGADYEIGHAYLMNLRYPHTLSKNEVREKVWEDSIKPLLEEYLRGSGRSEELIPDFQKAFGIE